MNNPYIVSRDERVENHEAKSAQDHLQETGRNTGNLLFISAIRRIVKHDPHTKFDPARISETHDGLVVPAANWLNPSSDLGDLAAAIEASQLPCVVVGLGAQSNRDDVFPTLTPGTARFLQVVSERSTTVSVRGEYSASVAEKAGAKNIRVTGCPSLLWWVDRPARVTKTPRTVSEVALHAKRSDADEGQRSTAALQLGLLIARTAMQMQHDYVAQTELSDIIVSKGQEAANAAQVSHSYLQQVYDSDDLPRITRYIKRHLKCFASVDDWVAFMRTKEFALGMRLHGTIAALLAGVPAVLITHDTRTREMARFCAIPAIEADEVLRTGVMDIQAIFDKADFTRFNARQEGYWANFIDFFEENRVEHNLGGASGVGSHSLSEPLTFPHP